MTKIHWIKKDTPQDRITQVRLTPAQLDQIANILNIPQSERGQFVAGAIHVDVPPPPSGGGTPPQGGGGSPSPSGGNPAPSETAGGGRPSG